MSHIIYHTEGIVLGGSPSGEAGRFMELLTADFGLIMGHAQGVRVLQSKLRYSLQNFSHARIDLVRGKAGWRITSAEGIGSFWKTPDVHRNSMNAIGRIARLLRRLLRGEEKNQPLFEDVKNGFALLSRETMSSEEAFAAEVVLVMRILNHLGYWGEDPVLSPFLTGDSIDRQHVERVRDYTPRAVRAINKALAETQL